jgi:hypothetical protein
VDDRDKDLTGLFVRDLDEIALPPRGAWRRARGRETTAMRASRYVLTAGAVVAVLAIALLIGFQLRDRGQSAATPSASPTPSASGAAVVNSSPSASPSGTDAPVASIGPAPGGAVYDDDFGFLVGEKNSSMSIRKESTDARLGSFNPTNPYVVAVSPDGTQVAYFAAGGGLQQLRIFPAAGNASEQTLLTLTEGARGGGVVWSSDGAALLYSTEKGNFGIGGLPTDTATLNIYELAAGGRHGTTLATETGTGWLYRPIGWDRSANVAAAGMTGEGGFMGKYVTVRTTAGTALTVNRTDMTAGSMVMGVVQASSDATVVSGVVIGGGSPSILYWPLADIAARKTAAMSPQSPRWQPGSHKLGFITGDGSFVLYNTDDGSARTVVTGVPNWSNVVTFRVDGSAVLLAAHEAPAAGITDFTLYRISDGAKATFQERVGLLFAVRFR